MAYNFLSGGFPFGAYQGGIATKAFQRQGAHGNLITFQIDWSKYAVGGEGLGGPNPNFMVVVNWEANANIPQPYFPKSIYIDNSNSVTPVFAYFSDTFYTVEVQPGAVGWFPVITTAPLVRIIAIGLETGFLPLTNISISNIEIQPYTNIAAPTAIAEWLASPVIGGGSSLTGIALINPGSWYTTGAIQISGAGGINGAAHGTIDAFGRFTNVFLDNGGTGFQGFPNIAASAAQTPPAVWTVAQGAAKGQFAIDNVSGNGFVWQANSVISPGSPASQTNPANSNFWTPTGVSGTPVTAVFQGQLGASGAAIITDGYGTPPLRDQYANGIVTISGTGVFTNNLFGTPFASGFIYLNEFHSRVTSIGGAPASAFWQLETSTGTSIVKMVYAIQGAPGVDVFPQSVIDINSGNIKLDATKTYRLNCTAFTSFVSLGLQHDLLWTYSLQ